MRKMCLGSPNAVRFASESASFQEPRGNETQAFEGYRENSAEPPKAQEREISSGEKDKFHVPSFVVAENDEFPGKYFANCFGDPANFHANARDSAH